jgi:anti-sigma factor RsiW
MTHFTPEELVDALDGTLGANRRAHLDTCDQCRREAASLHALMSDLRSSEVPEPSPLFWDRLSARVRQTIDEEPLSAPRRWFQWPVLVPVAGLAMLVIALIGALAQPTVSNSEATAVAAMSEPLDAVDAESEWALLADLVADLDYEAANEQGIATPVGAADAAVWQLSLGEQEELLRLLRAELGAGG